jgi:hypothetical protein
LSLIPRIKHKLSSATGTSISSSFAGAISIWDQSMTLSLKLLPSLDWTIFEVTKFALSVIDALLKNKIAIFKFVRKHKSARMEIENKYFPKQKQKPKINYNDRNR